MHLPGSDLVVSAILRVAQHATQRNYNFFKSLHRGAVWHSSSIFIYIYIQVIGV